MWTKTEEREYRKLTEPPNKEPLWTHKAAAVGQSESKRMQRFKAFLKEQGYRPTEEPVREG